MLSCVWEDVGLWAHWNHSFDIHLSYLGWHPGFSHPEFPQATLLGWLQWLRAWWQAFCCFYPESLKAPCGVVEEGGVVANRYNILCLLTWQAAFFIHTCERSKSKHSKSLWKSSKCIYDFTLEVSECPSWFFLMIMQVTMSRLDLNGGRA